MCPATPTPIQGDEALADQNGASSQNGPRNLGRLPANAPLPPPPPLNGGRDNGDPKKQFAAAMNLLSRAQYTQAQQAFRMYADAYPDSADASEARCYWTNDIAYSTKKDYDEAAHDFVELIKKYPMAQRAPDSMLKLGLALLELGQTKEGCATLAALPAKYLQTPRPATQTPRPQRPAKTPAAAELETAFAQRHGRVWRGGRASLWRSRAAAITTALMLLAATWARRQGVAAPAVLIVHDHGLREASGGEGGTGGVLGQSGRIAGPYSLLGGPEAAVGSIERQARAAPDIACLARWCRSAAGVAGRLLNGRISARIRPRPFCCAWAGAVGWTVFRPCSPRCLAGGRLCPA